MSTVTASEDLSCFSQCFLNLFGLGMYIPCIQSKCRKYGFLCLCHCVIKTVVAIKLPDHDYLFKRDAKMDY